VEATGVEDIENANDIRVIECRGGASFALEPLDGQLFLRFRCGENLQRNHAAQFPVFGQIHSSHTTLTKHIEQFVLPQDESRVLPCKKVPSLEGREELSFHEAGSAGGGIVGQVVVVSKVLSERGLIEKTASPDNFQEFGRASWGSHTQFFKGVEMGDWEDHGDEDV
jgi:hypothetical protein